MNRIRAFGTHLVVALALGYVLYFFSEAAFWAAWRPGDSPAELAFTWLAYSSIAYLLWAILVWGKVRGVAAMLVAGGLFGWLVEGTWAITLYGTDPTAPLPLSVVITGLQWHMLISVGVGLWALPRALHAASPTRTLLIAAGLGIGWGAWAPYLWSEEPALVQSPAAFLLFAGVMWGLLLLAYALLLHLDGGARRPSPWAVGVLSLLVATVFVLNAILPLGILPLFILPPLLALGLWLLVVAGRRAEGDLVLAAFRRPIPWARLALAATTPLWAAGTYSLAYLLWQGWWPGHIIIFVGLALAGAAAWIWAVVVTLRRRQQPPFRRRSSPPLLPKVPVDKRLPAR